jgi:FtsP/CotA-like multicopper oxidase with cupredoxin domain
MKKPFAGAFDIKMNERIAHCHNAYHAERGMIGLFSYVR